HPVVLGARRLERCEATAAAIRSDGGEAVALPLDLTDAESVAEFAKRADDAVGSTEVIVSNAGEVQPETAVDADPDSFARQVQVNLLGPQRLLHHVVPGMVERRRGDVVFITSEVARHPRPLMAAYVAAKSGLEGLARAMQMELEGTGVRVAMVRPGPAGTEQGSTWSPDQVERAMSAWTAWGLLRHSGYLRPRDIAAAVLAVVSTPRGTQLTLVEVEPEAPTP
ncbi:MAG: SDR family oxidoreductase, partial [Acidimicrobiales bacterium]